MTRYQKAVKDTKRPQKGRSRKTFQTYLSQKAFQAAAIARQTGFDAGYEKGIKDGISRADEDTKAVQEAAARDARIRLISAIGQAVQSLAALAGDARIDRCEKEI